MGEYAKAFDDGFPMIPLAWGRKDAEIIELIKGCLKEKKDAYEMGLVTDDDEVAY